MYFFPDTLLTIPTEGPVNFCIGRNAPMEVINAVIDFMEIDAEFARRHPRASCLPRGMRCKYHPLVYFIHLFIYLQTYLLVCNVMFFFL